MLNKIYDELMERWNLMVKFGGEWNAGYAEGVKHAMSIILEEKRKLEKLSSRNEHPSSYHMKKESNDAKY